MEGLPASSSTGNSPPPAAPTPSSAMEEFYKAQTELIKIQGEVALDFKRMIASMHQTLQHQPPPESTPPRDTHVPDLLEPGTSRKRPIPLQIDFDYTDRQKKNKGTAGLDSETEVEFSPFSAEILAEEIPPRFKAPLFEQYKGLTDPGEHLIAFEDAIAFCQLSSAIKARLFLTTLKESARRWFLGHPHGFFQSFAQLKSAFLTNFACVAKQTKRSVTLLLVTQRAGESLRDYISRFNSASRQVAGLTPDFFKQALISGLEHRGLRTSLSKMSSESMPGLLARIQKYLDSEDELATADSVAARRAPAATPAYHQKPAFQDRPQHPRRPYHDRPSRGEHNVINVEPGPIDVTKSLPPLNDHLDYIVSAIRGEPFFKRATKMYSEEALRDTTKWCTYHEQNGHDTNNCYRLKQLLDKLIESGHLDKFLVERNKNPDSGPATRVPQNQGPTGPEIRKRCI